MSALQRTAVAVAIAAMFGAYLPPTRIPSARDARTPDDIAPRRAKQAAKLARRAARAKHEGGAA